MVSKQASSLSLQSTPTPTLTPPPSSTSAVPASALPKATVLFSFTASCPEEVSVDENMVVAVVQQSDALGNDEWWLVRRRDGSQGPARSVLVPMTLALLCVHNIGFVPASYIRLR